MRKKAIVIPIMTVLIILLFYYVYNVRLETALPDEGWGRSSDLKASSNYPMEYYSYLEGEQLHVFMPEGKYVSYNVFDKNFKMIKEDEIQAEVAPGDPLWASGQQLIYLDDHQLILNQEGNNRVIAKDITSFTPTTTGVLYWVENELKEYIASTGENRSVHTYDYPIYKAIQAKNGQSILIALQVSDLELHFYSLYNSDSKKLLEYTGTGSETIENIMYDAGEQKGTAIIGKYIMTQGKRDYNAVELSFDLMTSAIEKKENYIFYDENGGELSNPRYVQISYHEEKPAILFVAEGNRVAKRFGYNVYHATSQKGAWVAERRSNTEDTPVRPQWISHDHIVWQTFDGKEYALQGTTNDEHFIKNSQSTTSDDYVSAFYYFISGLFSGFFMLVMGMVWIVPPLIFYGILMFVKSDLFEKNERGWAEPVGILLYVSTMIYMLNQVLNDQSFYAAPPYLNFEGSLIIWPLMISALTYLVYRWLIEKETGLFAGLFYYMGYNLLIMTCLFGPYLL